MIASETQKVIVRKLAIRHSHTPFFGVSVVPELQVAVLLLLLVDSLQPEILKKAELQIQLSIRRLNRCLNRSLLGILLVNLSIANHDGQRAGLQHPGRPQEENEGDQGGV